MENIFLSAVFATLLLSGIGQQNYSIDQANTTINFVYNYVNTINQSSYLIFSPNLTLSYKYLNDAVSTYKNSPSTAVLYALKAKNLADTQYSSISSYRKQSLWVISGFTVLMASLLYFFMMPIKNKHKKKRN